MDAVQIRASSMPELFDCPARWEAKHLLKMRLPVSEYTRIGTAVHAGTALYDQSVLDGNPLTADEAAGAVVDSLADRTEDTAWDELTPAKAEKIAIPLHGLYCEKIAPKQEYVAVEALCDNLTFRDIGITLSGTVDRVRVTEDGLGIADIKTGKMPVSADGTIKTRGHAAQLGVYELLASHALEQPVNSPAQIIGMNSAKTEAGRRYAIGEIKNAKDLLLDDEFGRPGLLRHAAAMFRSGDFFGNPKSTLCSEKYCPAYQICRWRK